jgi:hypothetical protein
MTVHVVLEIVAAFAIVIWGGVVWTRYCNRTNKPNAAWLLVWSWSYWKDFNGSERRQMILLALAAVALVLFSQLMK